MYYRDWLLNIYIFQCDVLSSIPSITARRSNNRIYRIQPLQSRAVTHSSMSPVFLKIHPNAPKSVQHSNTRPPQLHEYDTYRHRTVVENKCKREQARMVSSLLLSKRHTGEEKKKKRYFIYVYTDLLLLEKHFDGRATGLKKI